MCMAMSALDADSADAKDSPSLTSAIVEDWIREPTLQRSNKLGSVAVQRIAMHLCSQGMKPETEPGTFEPRMTGDKDFLLSPEFFVNHWFVFVELFQTFHGVLPDCQSDSRWFLSRSVSMAYQNPRCLWAIS